MVQRENEQAVGPKRRDSALRAGIFKARGSTDPMSFFTGGVTGTPPLFCHRVDESIGLSLGMVASPQSPLPFPPTKIYRLSDLET